MKRVNGVREEILIAVGSGQRTRNDIAEYTDRHYNTVRKHLEEFTEKGWVAERKVDLPDGGSRWEYELTEDAAVKLPSWSTWFEIAPLPVYLALGAFAPLHVDVPGVADVALAAAIAGGLPILQKLVFLFKAGDLRAAYVEAVPEEVDEDDPVSDDWKQEVTQ